ncbi:glucokinase [Spiribacter sp. 221]|uniref:glucokinase n=1 Tax=Spiribacter onubensis TaxID=3122420 RepID=UPI00349F9A12
MSTTRPDASPALVADIGGTNARAGLVTEPGQAPGTVFTRPTADFPGLAEFLQAAMAALSGEPRPMRVICAVASPLHEDTVRLTNAGWTFSISDTQRRLGLEALTLMNDWVAQGWAVTRLVEPQRLQRKGGKPAADAPRLAIGPGTGLGSALVTPCADHWQVFATEGGHISVGITSQREADLALRLHNRFGHCSAERVASGVGMEAVHDALREIDGHPPRSCSAETIAREAVAGDPLCREVLAQFTAALGSAAGDLALATGARGGIYVGGGIIPALGDAFDWNRFHARFTAKGRFQDYLAAIPVYAINHPAPALLGLSVYLEAQA